MELIDNLNTGKYNLILFAIIFVLLFHQYLMKSTTESMADISPDIKEAIKQIYLTDVEAIRNLSNVATQLQAGGLTIPGDLRITGNLLLGNKEKNQWILHTPPDERGGLWMSRIQRDGTVNWGNGLNMLTSPDGTQNLGGSFNLILRGTILTWTGAAVPPGWALCDGGNGTPDLRGRFILSSGQGGGLTNRAIGQVGGAETHVLNANEMPAHTHGYKDIYYSENGGNDPIIGTKAKGSGDSDNDNQGWSIDRNTVPVGGSAAHNNMPPFFVLAYIMKL